MRRFWIATSFSMLAITLGLVSTGVDAWAGPAPKPAEGMQESFPGCKWGEVKGREASIWSFQCGPQVSSGSHLVADDSLPGFVLKDDSPDAKDRVVIRFFKKTSGAAVPSVLPAVRAASPGRYTSRCALIPLPPREGSKEKLFSLEPTGGEGKAWEASQETSKMPDEPCGKLGPSYVGDRMFREMNGDPTRVVFIDMGSELQIFDPSTLTSVVP